MMDKRLDGKMDKWIYEWMHGCKLDGWMIKKDGLYIEHRLDDGWM